MVWRLCNGCVTSFMFYRCVKHRKTHVSNKHYAGDQTTTTLLEHSRDSIVGSLCCVYNNVPCNFCRNYTTAVRVVVRFCLFVCLFILFSVILMHAVVPVSCEDAPFYHWPISAKYSIYKVFKMNILNVHDHDAHNCDKDTMNGGWLH